MATMQKLSVDTVRLITSSQVITSVVSAIKELVENALDAGSDNIEVKLENYGLDKIEVRDNGTGIGPDDAPYMARSHFTSKISQHADLESLATYGFRGEALGSLCAVSSVTIATKTSDDAFGHQYVLDHDGGIVTSKPSHLGNGSTVTATHLFKTVPVRKQYYTNPKRRRDELKKVEDLIMSFGAICPTVRLSLSHNKSGLWQKSKAANHKAALINTWGSSVMSQMQHVQRLDDDTNVRIEGFVPALTSDSQSVTRALPDRCWIAVNGRPVNFKEIEKIVKQAYCTAVKHDVATVRHLVMFLSVTLPQQHVDVNLEPNKTKVMLQNKDAVLSVLSGLLGEAYGQTPDHHPAGTVNQQCTLHQEDNIIPNTSAVDSILGNTRTDKEDDLGSNGVGNTDDGNKAAPINCERKRGSEFQQRERGRRHCEREDDVSVCEKPKELTETCTITDLPSAHNLSSSPNSHSAGGADVQRDFKLNLSFLDDDFDLESFDEDKVMSVLEEAKSGESDSVEQSVLEHSATEENDNLVSVDSVKNTESASTSISLTDWSKGRGLTNKDGKPIEPATLLVPTNTNEQGLVTNHDSPGQLPANQNSAKSVLFDHKPSDSSPSTHSHLSTTDIVGIPDSMSFSNKSTTSSPANQETARSSTANQSGSPAKRRLSLEKKIGKGIMFDLVGQSPVRRPQSSFAFFSKEMRPQVVGKNPRANFSDVAKIVEEEWRQLEEDEKEKYEEMGRKDTERYRNQLRAAQRKLSAKQGMQEEVPSRKKKKLSLPSNQGLIDKMLLSQQQRKLANQLTETETPDIPTVDVTFSLIGLERELKTYETRNTDSDQRLHLIGQLASHGVWLARHSNQVVVFNQYRVEEALLYHRLMSYHVLACQPVDVPIMLSPSMVGGDHNWSILLEMPTRSTPPDPALYFTDERLTSNGFEVKQTVDSNTREVKLQVIGMATAISYYGMCDLQEILELISTDQCVLLSQCRPLKVANYLKGEAVRMARNLPSAMQAEDVHDVIRRMKQLPSQCGKCLHNQPFEYPLCTIPDSHV